ncbi:hypothetical protein LJC74_02495 [Eubacteriales bacterium OttesenSCG-928-A19]|nr:hypothetical protein [Eubacteriales bacterium OttesenSCG-928-A19]
MGTDNKSHQRRLIIHDDIPETEWCDLRVEYIHGGKSVAQIARERGCEARAISRLIKENRSFSELGRKRTPGKIDGYHAYIEEQLKSGRFQSMLLITTVSGELTGILKGMGYQGSERTVRDYLQTIPWREWILQQSKK